MALLKPPLKKLTPKPVDENSLSGDILHFFIHTAYIWDVHMGVTIYYQGQLNSPRDVPDLILEVCDIARTNQWKFRIMDDSWSSPISLRLDFDDEEPRFTGNSGLKGIVLSAHHESTPLALLFDAEGVCRSLEEMTAPPSQRNGGAHVSTQYAGIDVHIQLVNFLEYVGQRYFQDWQMDDDSGFAKSRDREQAIQVFEAVEDAINAVTEAFDTIEMPDDISGNEEEFLNLVEDRIRTFLPGAEIHRIDEEE